MNTTRETKTITVHDHTFTVKTYATARELNTIQGFVFKGMKVGVQGGAENPQPKFDQIDLSVEFDMKVEMVRQLVVQLDEETDPEKIVKYVTEECPNFVFDDLVEHLDLLIQKKVA